MKSVSSYALALIATVALACGLHCRAADKDNVHILDERISYTVQPSGKVKMVDQTTYVATRADDRLPPISMFNEDISIDKASAPGAKPYYRSWEPGDMFYTGSRICFMDVPLRKDKPAKVTFEQTYNVPEQFCNVYLKAPYFTDKSLITIEIPPVLAERYKVTPVNLDSCMTFKRTVGKNGSVVYSVESVGREAFRYEEDAPSAALDAPQLIVTGFFKDTDELYSFFRKYFEPAPDSSESIAALAADITAGCSSDIEIIDSIASWVRQNIRYVAVEHGEYGIRPEAAHTVLERRYGDCKGSANLIKALLHSSGIDGRLVWIGTAAEVSTRWDSVPSLMSGNHQIAAAVLPDTIIYADGTATWSPAGYVSQSLRRQQAMIEDGDSYMLRMVPDVGRDADTDTLTAHFAIDGSDLHGSIAHDMGGMFKISALGSYNDVDQSNRQQLLRYIISYPKKNVSCHDVRLEAPGPASQRCRIISDSISEHGAVYRAGDKLIVDLRPVRRNLGLIKTEKRKRGMVNPFAFTYVAHIILDIPEGCEVESMPADQTFDSPWFGGFITYRQKNGRIECDAEVSTRRNNAAVSELEARNAAIKAITRASESKIILKRI